MSKTPRWLLLLEFSIVLALAIPNFIPAFSRDLVALRLLKSMMIAPSDSFGLQGQSSVDALLAQMEARQLAQDAPDNAHVQYLAGMASLNVGDVNAAIAAFKRALELGIDPPYFGYQQLGAAYRMAQEPKLAVKSWVASGNIRPALAWGYGLLELGSPDKALTIFQALAEMGGNTNNCAEGRYGMAMAWATHGRWDLALLELEQAYQLRPDHLATLVDLARALYFTGGDQARAEALIERAAEIEPSNEWMASVLSDMYVSVGNLELAAFWQRRLEDVQSRTKQDQ